MKTGITWDEGSGTLKTSSGFAIESINWCEFDVDLNEVRSVPLDDLGAELARVLKSPRNRNRGFASLSVSSSVHGGDDGEPYGFDTFLIGDDALLFHELQVSGPIIENSVGIAELIEPMLEAHGVSLAAVPEYRRGGAGPDGRWPWVELLLLHPAGAVINDCIRLSKVVVQVLTQRSLNPNTPFGAYSLAVVGSFSALIGQSESQWLEAKAKGYGLENDRQKHELACDVSALANADMGGVIIVGLATQKNELGDDVVRSAPGCHPGDINVEQYVEVAKNRIVPSIEGLIMKICEAGNRHYLLLYIPAQAEYLKPFIVKGGVVANNRWTRAAFTINTRVGSDKWAMSAEAIHALLVSARAVRANPSTT